MEFIKAVRSRGIFNPSPLACPRIADCKSASQFSRIANPPERNFCYNKNHKNSSSDVFALRASVAMSWPCASKRALWHQPAIPTRCLATKDIFRGKNNENRRHFSRHNQHDVLTLLPLQSVGTTGYTFPRALPWAMCLLPLQGVLPNATVRSGGVFFVFATTMAAFGNQTGVFLQSVRKLAFRHKRGRTAHRAEGLSHHEWVFYDFCLYHINTESRIT